MHRVFCNGCTYLHKLDHNLIRKGDYECQHDSNIKFVDKSNWFESVESYEYQQSPDDKNKLNNCIYFKVGSNRSNNGK